VAEEARRAEDAAEGAEDASEAEMAEEARGVDGASKEAEGTTCAGGEVAVEARCVEGVAEGLRAPLWEGWWQRRPDALKRRQRGARTPPRKG
jgi:hypothetical protein